MPNMNCIKVEYPNGTVVKMDVRQWAQTVIGDPDRAVSLIYFMLDPKVASFTRDDDTTHTILDRDECSFQANVYRKLIQED